MSFFKHLLRGWMGGDYAGNSPGARFWAQCGAALQGAPCAACGKEVPPGAKFCPGCGQSVRRTSP